jgi:hypothetical protein
MSLSEALGDWLTDDDPGELLHELDAAGPDGQWRATLLDAHLQGTRTLRLTAPTAWAGGLAFLGADPPAEAPQGSLWFDPRELQLHLLVARDPGEVPKGTDPALSWLSTEPVRLFQWRSFLENAFMERAGTPPDFIPFLPRDFRGPDLAAATGMSAPEARLYAVWLGKALPTLYDWECAATLGDHRLQDLWAGASTREWLADDAGDDSVRVAAGPRQWEIDPSDQFEEIELGDDLSDDERIVFPRTTRTADFGLRTRVLVQFGLVREMSDRGATECGQRLVAKARR